MEIYNNISNLKNRLKELKLNSKTIGFVPTMGFLHSGHSSLIKKSALENDFTVVSIYVNPTQFGEDEDFEKYPRDIDKDTNLVSRSGGDIIFVPSTLEMYPSGYSTYVEVTDFSSILCGLTRDDHFRGVSTVVTKLFNIVRADKAYFGQKDAQQAVLITKLVRDLNIDTAIITCETIRESDGLAMSSRNVYLKPPERDQATIIYRSLELASKILKSGEKSSDKIKNALFSNIETMPLAEIEYVEIVDTKDLIAIEYIEDNALVLVAVRFGTTRLIDNIIITVD